MTLEPEKTVEEKLEALEDFIKSGTSKDRETFRREMGGLFSDIVGFCLDQIELSYPHDKADAQSENKIKFDIAKRMVLNKLNQDTYNKLSKLLSQYSTIRIIEQEADIHNIKFAKPILATGKRSKG